MLVIFICQISESALKSQIWFLICLKFYKRTKNIIIMIEYNAERFFSKAKRFALFEDSATHSLKAGRMVT